MQILSSSKSFYSKTISRNHRFAQQNSSNAVGFFKINFVLILTIQVTVPLSAKIALSCLESARQFVSLRVVKCFVICESKFR